MVIAMKNSMKMNWKTNPLQHKNRLRLFSDRNAIGPSPDDILEYTIELQISDYFGFDDLIFTDTFSDGQHSDESFQPTFTSTEINSPCLVILQMRVI